MVSQWKEAGFAAGITVTTYNMMATSGNRSYETESILDLLLRTEWGLVILDEVHVTPADSASHFLFVCLCICFSN